MLRNGSNVGPEGTSVCNKNVQMETFDNLPSYIREFLSVATMNYDARDLLWMAEVPAVAGLPGLERYDREFSKQAHEEAYEPDKVFWRNPKGVSVSRPAPAGPAAKDGIYPDTIFRGDRKKVVDEGFNL